MLSQNEKHHLYAFLLPLTNVELLGILDPQWILKGRLIGKIDVGVNWAQLLLPFGCLRS